VQSLFITSKCSDGIRLVQLLLIARALSLVLAHCRALPMQSCVIVDCFEMKRIFCSGSFCVAVTRRLHEKKKVGSLLVLTSGSSLWCRGEQCGSENLSVW
jgi:hypothetical protein